MKIIKWIELMKGVEDVLREVGWVTRVGVVTHVT